jgi:hypothetical protein
LATSFYDQELETALCHLGAYFSKPLLVFVASKWQFNHLLSMLWPDQRSRANPPLTIEAVSTSAARAARCSPALRNSKTGPGCCPIACDYRYSNRIPYCRRHACHLQRHARNKQCQQFRCCCPNGQFDKRSQFDPRHFTNIGQFGGAPTRRFPISGISAILFLNSI